MSVEKIPEIALDGLEAKFLALGEKTKGVIESFQGLFQTAEVIENLGELETVDFCNRFEEFCRGNSEVAQLLGLQNVE